MKITFLGTGTSQGVPVIACPCRVCTSKDSRDKRLRSSIMIDSGQTRVVIDTGPDFRQQMLREHVEKLDAVVFTHEHKDHIAGFDDIRAFNYFQRRKMDVYATDEVQDAIRREFPYIFFKDKYPGVPEIELFKIEENKAFSIGDITLEPLPVMHYKMPVLGFKVKRFVYITDANYISEQVKEKIKGVDVLVLNALRRERHISHFTLEEAVSLISELSPTKAYLTHLSHQMGLSKDISGELPNGIELAFDGLSFELS